MVVQWRLDIHCEYCRRNATILKGNWNRRLSLWGITTPVRVYGVNDVTRQYYLHVYNGAECNTGHKMKDVPFKLKIGALIEDLKMTTS